MQRHPLGQEQKDGTAVGCQSQQHDDAEEERAHCSLKAIKTWERMSIDYDNIHEQIDLGSSPRRKEVSLMPGSQQGRPDGIASGWSNVTPVQ